MNGESKPEMISGCGFMEKVVDGEGGREKSEVVFTVRYGVSLGREKARWVCCERKKWRDFPENQS